MTNPTLALRLLSLVGSTFLGACGGSSPTAPDVQADVVAQSITAGTWVISTYTQRTEDKTSDFSGYLFTFTKTAGDAGTVTATRNGSTVTGTWSHQAAVTYYGSTSTEAMVLNFGAATLWTKVSKIWNVSAASAGSLALVSPEVVEDERLVFTRR
jgi:hypothetical protein